MKISDRILSIIFLIMVVAMAGLIIYALNIPSAESIYIPRSELKELF